MDAKNDTVQSVSGREATLRTLDTVAPQVPKEVAHSEGDQIWSLLRNEKILWHGHLFKSVIPLSSKTQRPQGYDSPGDEAEHCIEFSPVGF